jgi:hypothetical protein
MPRTLYPSLEKVPDVIVDEYGNLRFKQEDPNRDGLRKRFELASRLPLRALAGTTLSHLLNWTRWDSETGVMWECTLPELLALVTRWEKANPNASVQLYGCRETPASEYWEKLWKKAWRGGISTRHMCVCKRYFRTGEMQCPTCDTWRYQAGTKDVPTGPRGKYNLILNGADGYNIAKAAFETRNGECPLPKELPIAPRAY